MIEFLVGELASKSPMVVTIQGGAVGYEVRIPLSTYEALPECGRRVKLLTHLYLRENDAKLFGFATEAERDLFRLLLGVSRVGPMVALQILSSCSVEDLRRYIATGDEDTLSTLKGIGKKTAQRLIVELRAALQQTELEFAGAAPGQPAMDAIKTLVSLGSSRREAEKAVRAAVKELGEGARCEELLKAALAVRKP